WKLFNDITSIDNIQPGRCGSVLLLMIIIAFRNFIFFALRAYAFEWSVKYMDLAGNQFLLSLINGFLSSLCSNIRIQRRQIYSAVLKAPAPVNRDFLAVDHSLNSLCHIDTPVNTRGDQGSVRSSLDHIVVVTNLPYAVILCRCSRSR